MSPPSPSLYGTDLGSVSLLSSSRRSFEPRSPEFRTGHHYQPSPQLGSSPRSSRTSDMSAAAVIPSVPVPRIPSAVSYSPNMSTGRSPPSTSSNSSAYRSHPYHRRMSTGPSSSSSGPSNSHILLPPPNSLAPLRVPDKHDNHPAAAAASAQRPPSPGWPPKRPSLDGPSSTDGSRNSGGGISLPSLRSLSRQTSPSAQSPVMPTPGSSGAPSYHHGGPGDSPTSLGRSRPSPPKSHPSLRPSYYEHSVHASPYQLASHSIPDHRYEYDHDPYDSRTREDHSPPLREIRYADPYYAQVNGGGGGGGGHSMAHPAHPHHAGMPYGYAPAAHAHSMSRHGSRSRSQSINGGARNGHTHRMDLDEEPAPGPGQNRRIAHLMSEQKRRESINTGFQALRTVIPSATPTDSKANILRKAVAHIQKLERAMSQAGVSYSPPEAEWADGAERAASGAMDRVPSGDDLIEEEDAVSDEGTREYAGKKPAQSAVPLGASVPAPNGPLLKKEPLWDDAARRRVSE